MKSKKESYLKRDNGLIEPITIVKSYIKTYKNFVSKIFVELTKKDGKEPIKYGQDLIKKSKFIKITRYIAKGVEEVELKINYGTIHLMIDPSTMPVIQEKDKEVQLRIETHLKQRTTAKGLLRKQDYEELVFSIPIVDTRFKDKIEFRYRYVGENEFAIREVIMRQNELWFSDGQVSPCLMEAIMLRYKELKDKKFFKERK